jgi:hypothetical protein
LVDAIVSAYQFEGVESIVWYSEFGQQPLEISETEGAAVAA